uniref:Uncharacterized protein n=1 Tax=Bodo saltans TaxID=75058 RepID=B6DTP0_BODSA|nr:hypothetical protein [Bodo saltans]
MFSVRPPSAAFSDSDDDDENSKSAAPSLPPGVVAPPPHGAYESRLWSRMNEVLPDKSSVMAVRGVDFGSHRYQLLHHEIDDIVRTKGRMNHTELVCLEDPTSREETPMSSPRTTTGEANGVGGGAAKKVSPTHASAKQVLHPRKQRYLAMKTVAYEAYTPNIYKSNGKAVNDSANFASFRFSFITLFFVGVACGKFKRLLRRRTLAEQQERYGEMLTKSVAARLEHINKPEAKGYSIRSARDLVQRITREGTAKFNLAIKNSNEMARRVRLNPRAALTARNNAADSSSVDALQQSLPIVTPGTTIRLGDFLVNNNNLNLPFITATTGIHGRNGSLEESATGFGAAPVGGGGGGGGIVPVLDISASQIMGSPFNVTNNNRSGGQRPGFLSQQQSPRPVRGASTATALENSPRFGSFYQNEAPSLASTARVIPAFELFSDANVFVTNLQWEEMEYVPLSERSKKTLVLQRQVRESDLQKFTQTIVPASSKRIQESSTSAAKKPPGDGPAVADSPNKNSARNGASGSESSGGGPTDQSRQHQLGLVSSHTSFSRHKDAPPAPAQDLTQAQKTAMLQLLALQQANLDINLKGAAVYEPGKKSMARSDNSVSGIRATRSIARPDPSVPFNFYSWRSKQNRALFHHLCQEHRELMLETAAAVAGGMTSAGSGGGTQPQPPPPPPGNGFEFNMSANAAFSGESPGDPQLTPREPNGGGLSQKELQALRERVRRRAEEVEFNDRDSASTTYGAFLVHKNVEHADFLKRSMAEVERLLATKEALSRVPKRAQLLESIDHQHESGIFLAERFLESVAKLDDGIRQN